jgi:hypothetical protein
MKLNWINPKLCWMFALHLSCQAMESLLSLEITPQELSQILSQNQLNSISIPADTAFVFQKQEKFYSGKVTAAFAKPDLVSPHLKIVVSSKEPHRAFYELQYSGGPAGSFLVEEVPGESSLPLNQLVQKNQPNSAIGNPENDQRKYRVGDLVIGGLDPAYSKSEKDRPDNSPDKKSHSRLLRNNGVLLKESDQSPFTTESPPKAFNDSGTWIWIMDKKGVLYTDTMYGSRSGAAIGNQHSFFKKTIDGIGKPIACGGHIKVNPKGKVIELDNSSGHYKPNPDQFILAVQKMDADGVFDEKVILHAYDGQSSRTYTLAEVRNLSKQEILQKYPEKLN